MTIIWTLLLYAYIFAANFMKESSNNHDNDQAKQRRTQDEN